MIKNLITNQNIYCSLYTYLLLNEVNIMSIYEKIGVKTIINAAGNWTILGGSIMSDNVLQAMVEAGKYFVDMKELHKKAGEIIAKITGAEAEWLHRVLLVEYYLLLLLV